ncbi:MarR family winged helix-turn-helix transcriptional regulator [Sorangium cellulosum]|uniref:MarR family winged helix-turn-helix transcriptional regulator n=1 Tax=Sorangium cellulosum TaxID=56 RepID=UPI000A6A9CE5|nr:MarR family transcriptional regulator [Sorangium cellulosum]
MTTRELRSEVRAFVRGFGLLDEERTPCGVEVAPREAHALAILAEAEQAGAQLTQSDLRRALGVDKSNVTRLIQRLRDDGRVAQDVSEADGRVRRLRLTAAGRRLAGRLEARSLLRFQSILDAIPCAERDAVVRALHVLNGALRRATEEPSHASDARDAI